MLKFIDIFQGELPLESVQEGHKLSENDSVTLFQPWLRTTCDSNAHLRHDATYREYKGLAIIFNPKKENSRAETAAHFKTPSFGLVVAPETSSELLPDIIYSHYGELEVRIEEFSILNLTTPSLHEKLFEYTLKILSLLIQDIDEDLFKQTCRFYIIPLQQNTGLGGDKHNWAIDLEELDTFANENGGTFGPGDIVKRNPKLFEGYLLSQYFLLRKIHHDMNPSSVIPGIGKTFLEYAIEKNRIADQSECRMEQYAVELMTISLKNSTLNWAKYTPDDRTESIFLLQDDIVPFRQLTSDKFFQAPCLLPLIYKILIASSTYYLDKLFLNHTRHRRNEITKQWRPSDIKAEPHHGKRPKCHSSDDLETNLATPRKIKIDSHPRPPVLFDRNMAPFRIGSRLRAMAEALTQKSAGEPYSLEFVEIVGDSFLRYTVSVALYILFDDDDEGELTQKRSHMVSNKRFEYLAKKGELGGFAIARKFDKSLLTYLLGGKKGSEQHYHNRMGPKALADIFEAIIGASLIYHGQHEAILAMDWLGFGFFEKYNNQIFDEFHESAVSFKRTSPQVGMDKEMSIDYKSKLKPFEKIIGYKFNYPSLLVEALTHGSIMDRFTRSYGRLEFLGDAILDFSVLMTIIKQSGWVDPGRITICKSALVNNNLFAMIALIHRFPDFIQCNSIPIEKQLYLARGISHHDMDAAKLNLGSKSKVISDVFESVAGAIYIDSGCSLDVVWGCYYPMMKRFIDQEIQKSLKLPEGILHEK